MSDTFNINLSTTENVYSVDLVSPVTQYDVEYTPVVLTGLVPYTYATSNTIYVDGDNGNDLTGSRETLKPFKTISAALSAALSGDILIIRPTTYTERIALVDDVNLYFEKGATLTWTSDNEPLIYDNSAVTVSILGHGSFIHNGPSAGSEIVELNSATTLNIKGSLLKSLNGRGIATYGDAIVTSDFELYDTSDGTFDNVSSGSNLYVYGKRAVSNGYVLENDGGEINCYIKEIESLTTNPVERSSSGTISIFNTKVIAPDGEYGIVNSGFVNDIILEGVEIVTTKSDAINANAYFGNYIHNISGVYTQYSNASETIINGNTSVVSGNERSLVLSTDTYQYMLGDIDGGDGETYLEISSPDGLTTLYNSDLVVEGNLSIGGQFLASDTVTLLNSLQVTESVNFSDTLTVHQLATFNNDVSVVGTLTASNISGVNTGDQDLLGLVPYTGAKTDVNLGIHEITTTNLNLPVTGVIEWSSGEQISNNSGEINITSATGLNIQMNNSVSIGTTPNYSANRLLKIHDDGGVDGARASLIGTTGTIYPPAIELLYDGDAVKRVLLRIEDEGSTNYGMSFYTSSGGATTSKLRILGDGNVGIGNVDPEYKLDITGNLAVEGSAYALPATTGTTQSTGLGLRVQNASGNVVLDIGDAGATGTWLQTSLKSSLATQYPLLLQPNGGDIGIGNVDPQFKLDITGDMAVQGSAYALPATTGDTQSTGLSLRAQNGGGNIVLDIGNAGATGTWLQTSLKSNLATQYPLLLQPNGGNVGIGLITAPTEKLSVGGSAIIDGNLTLGSSLGDYSNGVIYKDGERFLHDFRPTGATGYNVFLGRGAGSLATTAPAAYNSTANVGIGPSALRALTTGYQNVAIGNSALYNITTGAANMAMGYAALQNLTTSSANIGLGGYAGRYADGLVNNTSANGSIYIGGYTKALTSGATNEIVIGKDAVGNGSNSVTLGHDTITKTILKGEVELTTVASGIVLSSPDGSRFRITVDNSGVLSTTAL